MLPSFTDLRDVRERLGYRQEFVARSTGIGEDRLRILEEDQSVLTIWEAEVLGRLYGLDSDALSESPIRTAGDVIAVLQYADEFREVTDATRASIVGAANAARDVVRLRRLIGLECNVPLPELRAERARALPYRQGATKAGLLRRLLSLRAEPIWSLRDFVREYLPSIVVLYARMGSHGPAGLTFADQLRGPTIVLNTEGKNENPLVRRFSLAHEVCHVLLDWNRAEPLAVLSGYLTESGLEKEQRANAFAVRLLCPQQVLASVRTMSPQEAAKKLFAFGLPYAAIRLYLRNEANMDLPRVAANLGLTASAGSAWAEAERPDGLEEFPLTSAPLERRTAVAQAAATAHSLGKIGRDAFAEALGVAPTEDVERVLDFFALDAPVEDLDDAA